MLRPPRSTARPRVSMFPPKAGTLTSGVEPFTYARAALPLTRELRPQPTCTKSSLHVQSPAVPATASGTLAR
eukprot:15212718-Alexandrium_andersonii.AAC.1